MQKQHRAHEVSLSAYQFFLFIKIPDFVYVCMSIPIYFLHHRVVYTGVGKSRFQLHSDILLSK